MRAAKQLIFDHVPETCYRTLDEKHTGYVKVTYLELFDHLIEGFGELSENEMQDNDKRIKKETTSDTHFEELVQHIEDYVENAASQNSYTTEQTILIGFNIIDKSGFYIKYCQEWRRTAKSDKTWSKYKIHFARAFKETRKSNKIAGNSGYKI